ncbi:U-box domain-containing protein 4-like [Macadamia integrifolia]|uniref:U-box domain-containing protein 4-like n=1 Tax=Macadamia integrifolia TaxID=60698 RepID=UPI001C4F0A9B|nr:U-box domain-containing protein 4-like [Macadamia integrifolia]
MKACVEGLQSSSIAIKRLAVAKLRLLAENRAIIGESGTEVSKQNAACALLSLMLIEDNKISIGACEAIPPLVSLLLNGSTRWKKDALTTLYKLCTVRQNKEKAVSVGAVKLLVGMVSEQGSSLAEKAMVVLTSLATIPEGKTAIVEEGGIPAQTQMGQLAARAEAMSRELEVCEREKVYQQKNIMPETVKTIF